MEAYCSRCQSAPSVTDEQLSLGACPTCGGQISTTAHSLMLGIEGAVGMTFSVGSQVALPLSMPFEQNTFEDSRRDTLVFQRPPEPPPDDDAEPEAPKAFEPPSFDGSDSAASDEDDLPPAPVVDPSSEGDVDAEAALPAAPVVASSPDEDDLPPAPVVSSDTPAPGDNALPAHLQLPSIDFSMPSFGTAPAGDPDTQSALPPVAAGADGELPAHLNLPSFPAFDLPPVPGMDPAPGDSADSTDPGLPAHLAPPPTPPPPPRRRKTQDIVAAPEETMAPMPGLPDLGGMPTFGGGEAPKKEVTLLNSAAAAELAEQPAKKFPVGLVAGVVLVLALAGGIWVKRDAVIGFASSQFTAPPVQETVEDKARAAFLAAQKAYEENKLDVAQEKFAAALALLPQYARAHRGLAITFAKMAKPAEAVSHYRTYLSLEPTAKDAAEVRKIVQDYDKSQKNKPAPKVEEKPADPEAADKTAKVKKKKR